MKPSIFVTRRLPEAAMNKLAEYFMVSCNPEDRVLSKGELIDGVRGKDALLCLLTDAVDGEVMDASDQLKVISNYAVGFNNIDLDAANKRGIPVCNTPGVLSEATADLTWALLLGIARRIVEGDAMMRSGSFDGWAPLMLLGGDFYGRTLGIIGMGRIGKAVARRAQGFGMRIIYSGCKAEGKPGEHCSMEKLLEESDYVSIHCPYNDKTHHLIGAKELRLMKQTAYLVNTARGPIVSEQALLQALRTGEIAGAGLDVFEHEPKMVAGLEELDNVLLLPHIGSATIETRTKMGMMAAENAIAIMENKQPHSLAC